MMLFNFGSLSSSGRRVSATMEVIDSLAMASCKTALPTVPVEPVIITFILTRYSRFLNTRLREVYEEVAN